jgi:hypothetical protein
LCHHIVKNVMPLKTRLSRPMLRQSPRNETEILDRTRNYT